MTDITFKAGKTTYVAKMVTLADVSLEELFADGALNQKRMIELAIRTPEGAPVDLATVPIGHVGVMIRYAMQACGFDVEGAEAGND